jgi:hypothetical protein
MRARKQRAKTQKMKPELQISLRRRWKPAGRRETSEWAAQERGWRHQILIALRKAHAVNVAAVGAVLPADWRFRNTRPPEQLHLQSCIMRRRGEGNIFFFAKHITSMLPCRNRRQWRRQLRNVIDTNLQTQHENGQRTAEGRQRLPLMSVPSLLGGHMLCNDKTSPPRAM